MTINWMNFIYNLKYLGMGMLGVALVILAIIIITVLVTKISSKKQKSEAWMNRPSGRELRGQTDATVKKLVLAAA